MGQKWDGGDIAFRPETWGAVLRVLKPGAYILAFSSSRTFGRMSVAIEDAGFIVHPFIAWIFGQGFPKAQKVDDPAWQGWHYGGQALKPAIEPIFMGQKPFSEKNGTANVLRHGTGALNIYGCRVPAVGGSPSIERRRQGAPASCRPGKYGHTIVNRITPERYEQERPGEALGRWPANVIHDGSEEVLRAFPEAPGQQRRVRGDEPSTPAKNVYGAFGRSPSSLPRGDDGSAARFFYTSKADKADRLQSRHPTVKPVDLIAYLCRLITSPGGTILDPFAGSGTAGMAAMREGFRAILVEKEAEYYRDILKRLDHVQGADAPLFSALSNP
jgi:site-specific DNA-methyltransferase (adenine-specific)